jgi:hypothetical protein
MIVMQMFVGRSQAQEFIIGDKDAEGRIQLLYEPVEGVYGNFWSGMRVSGNGKNQTDIHVRGEGKTAMFEGILSLNCESKSGHLWLTSERDANETVPTEVIANARRFFCAPQ